MPPIPSCGDATGKAWRHSLWLARCAAASTQSRVTGAVACVVVSGCMPNEHTNGTQITLGDISVVIPEIPGSGGWQGGPLSRDHYERLRTDFVRSESHGAWDYGQGPSVLVERRRWIPGAVPDYNAYPLGNAEYAGAVIDFTMASASLIERCGLSIWASVDERGVAAVISVAEASGEAAVLIVTVVSRGQFAPEAVNIFPTVFGSVTDAAGNRISTCTGDDALQNEFEQIVAIHNEAAAAQGYSSTPPVPADEVESDPFAGNDFVVEPEDLDTLLRRAAYVRITAPVPIEELEDGIIPVDYPGLVDGFWRADIKLSSGQIDNWPGYDRSLKLGLKLITDGRYELLDDDQHVIALMTGHVPTRLVPGLFGEYLALQIDPDGQVTNWLDTPTLEDFIPDPHPDSYLEYRIYNPAQD